MVAGNPILSTERAARIVLHLTPGGKLARLARAAVYVRFYRAPAMLHGRWHNSPRLFSVAPSAPWDLASEPQCQV